MHRLCAKAPLPTLEMVKRANTLWTLTPGRVVTVPTLEMSNLPIRKLMWSTFALMVTRMCKAPFRCRVLREKNLVPPKPKMVGLTLQARSLLACWVLARLRTKTLPLTRVQWWSLMVLLRSDMVK